jgi:hypothetical protein
VIVPYNERHTVFKWSLTLERDLALVILFKLRRIVRKLNILYVKRSHLSNRSNQFPFVDAFLGRSGADLEKYV